MELDDTLIRQILVYVERNSNGKEMLPIPSLPPFTRDQVFYHADICCQAGWIRPCAPTMGPEMELGTLTWEGQQKLRAMREAC